jgi:hypothetical protein
VGTITAMGTVAPGGASSQTLNDNGDLNLMDTSAFTVALNSATSFSQLAVSGEIEIEGAALNATAGFTPTGNTQFTIIKNSGSSAVSGTFAGLPEGAELMISGHPYQITYQGGADHRDVVLTSLETTTTTLQTTPTPPVMNGTPVSFTATVSSGAGTPTGSVEFFNGTSSLGSIGLNDGMASLNNVVLPVGSNPITAVYSGDNTFGTSTSAPTSVVVTTGSNTALSVNPTTSVTGQSTTLMAVVSGQGTGTGAPAPTGSVEFFAVTSSGMTSLGSTPLSGGVATMTTNALTTADTSIAAHYAGDAVYMPSDAAAVTVMVSQADTNTVLGIAPNPSGLNSQVTLTATVTATNLGTGTPTGMVNFVSGGSTLGSGSLNSSGVATFNISTLPLGDTSITADYEGDPNYAPSTSPAMTATVKENSNTTLSANPTTTHFGQSTTLTAMVMAAVSGTGMPTGDVKFFDGNTQIGIGTLNNGTVALPIATLTAGTHNLTAQYQGDTTFEASTSPIATVTVSPATTMAVVAITPNPATVGQTVTLSATVTAVPPGVGTPTGTVDFFNGGTHLGSAPLGSGGVAMLPNITLPAGTNPITATYQGDGNFMGVTSPAVNAVVNQATTTTLTGPTSPVLVGQTFTLTATVTPSTGTGTPTGNVQFFNGSTSLGNATLTSGVATLPNVSFAAVNTYSVTATYSGDTTFAGSTSQPLTVTVNQASTTTAVTVTPSPSNFGSAVTLAATIKPVSPAAGTPTGSVEFFTGTTSLGAVALTNGVGTIATSGLTLGTNTITAQYRGDTNFAASTSPPITTNVLNPTTTTVSSSPSPSVFGQPVTLTAAVSSTGGTPTGIVQFLNGTTALGNGTLSNGVASIMTRALPVGANSITAAYLGDSSFGASTSAAITQTVNKASTTTLLTSSANPSGLGQGVTFTATVSPSGLGAGLPTGTVQFFNGSVSLGTANLIAGVATFSTSSLPQGTSTITATYSSDANFTASTSNAVSQSVSLGNSAVTLTASKLNPVATESIVLTAKVAAISPATGTPTGTVVFMSNGTVLGSGTLSGGTATLTTSIANLGSQSVTAVYQGDSNFSPATSAPLNLVVGDSNELYLNQVYQKLFHAGVESTGLSTWQPLLADGIPRKRIIRLIIPSNSLTNTSTKLLRQILGPNASVRGGHAKLASDLFTAILGQPPTAKQTKFYVNVLNEGGTTAVIVSLLASTQFYVQATANA